MSQVLCRVLSHTGQYITHALYIPLLSHLLEIYIQTFIQTQMIQTLSNGEDFDTATKLGWSLVNFHPTKNRPTQ